MPRGRTRSSFGLSQRRELAFKRFLQGYNNTDIAREIEVTADTVARYRAEYEARIKEQAEANPRLLLNVVENTVKALQELEYVRQAAWDEYEGAESTTARNNALNTLVRIGDQRAKLFGLFGVRTEYFIHVQQVQQMQERLLAWMRRELCADDRDKLEEFLRTEIAQFVGEPGAITPLEPSALAPIEVPAQESRLTRTRRG